MSRLLFPVPTLSNHLRTLWQTPQLLKGKSPRLKKAPAASAVKQITESPVITARAAQKLKEWEAQEAAQAKLLGRKPVDDTYFADMYERELVTMETAVKRHVEFCSPAMLDCLNNTLFALIVLNMRTKKKTKFVLKVEGHLLLPHVLDFLPPRKVLAFCQEPSEIEAALNNGALDAGANDLIVKVEHGHYHWEAYDHAVATPAMVEPLHKLRHVLREKLPTLKNGRVGTELGALVHKFTHGIMIDSKKSDGIQEIAEVKVPLGQVSWPVEKLKENLEACVREILVTASHRIAGEVIRSVILTCPPSDEAFALELSFVNQLKPRQQPSPGRKKENEEDVEDEESPEATAVSA